MAAITLEVAKKHLEMWLEAESEVAINQSYTIGGKSFTTVVILRNSGKAHSILP